jgi:hypothetical protein
MQGGALPGTSYTVTGASWTSGSPSYVTLTLGTHAIKTGQQIGIGGILPADSGNPPNGYNNGGATACVTAVTSTTIQFSMATNPGTYVSGGTVLVSGAAPFINQLALDGSYHLWVWNGSAWVIPTTGLTLDVNNNLTLPNNLTVSGALAITGNTSIAGNLTLTGNLIGSSGSLYISGTNVGIGNPSPSYPVDVLGSFAGTVRICVRNSYSGTGPVYASYTIASDTITPGNAGLFLANSQTSNVYGGPCVLTLLQVGSYPVSICTNNALRILVRANGIVNMTNVPVYASDSAAGTGGLVTGDLWKDSSGNVHIKS